jgi:hypothetical protein
MRMMDPSAIVLLLTCCLSAQSPVNIRGRITDADDGSPVAKAYVRLMNSGLTDSSKTDGSFRLTNAAVASRSTGRNRVSDITLNNGAIGFTLTGQQSVSVSITRPNGARTTILKNKILGPGFHTLRLSANNHRPPGVVVLRIEFGSRSTLLKAVFLNDRSGTPLRQTFTTGPILAKLRTAVDTIQIIRKGYVAKKTAVNTFSDSIPVMLVWRAFADSSAWNTRIPSAAQTDDSSTSYISDLSTSCQWDFLGINIAGYSIPVFYADSATTPRYQVTCTDVTGSGFGKPVPIPDNAAPDSLSDHHLCIIDKTLGREWGMWNAVKQATTWQCGVGASSDLNGSGVRPPAPLANPWQMAHGARASGFPLIAGLIKVGDIKGGRIDHALALAYPHCRSRYFIPPASTAQGTTSDALPTRGIPMGGLIQLDPTINVDTLKITAAGKIIARALQEYGAYICDYSGAINLYADGSPAARSYWKSGALQTYEFSDVFNAAMLRKFRLIKMSAFYDNNN